MVTSGLNERWPDGSGRLTVGRNGLPTRCPSWSPGLPCSAPALTVGSVSPPGGAFAARTANSLSAPTFREMEGEGGRERERERVKKKKKKEAAVCKLLMRKHDKAPSRQWITGLLSAATSASQGTGRFQFNSVWICIYFIAQTASSVVGNPRGACECFKKYILKYE